MINESVTFKLSFNKKVNLDFTAIYYFFSLKFTIMNWFMAKGKRKHQFQKAKICFFLISILIFCVGCEKKQVTNAHNNLVAGNDFFADSILSVIHKNLEIFPNHTQVSFAAIVKHNLYFYGVIRENDSLSFIENHNRVFEIGSVTKVFTSTILANLIVDGTIRTDDIINQYLDFQLKDSISFTFESLSNHSSGLPRMPSNFTLQAIINRNNPYKNYKEKDLKKYLINDLKLTYKQGENSEYSNLGAGLLGYAIEKVTGQNYQQLVHDKVFIKYDMKSSTTIKQDITDILVMGRNNKGKITPNWDLSVLIGAGGIYSTVEDLAKFAVAQFNIANSELRLTQIKTFTVNDDMDMGLGWHIIKQKADGEIFWHNGGTGGYRSSMAVDVENQNGIIILSNISAFHENADKIDFLCFQLMKHLKERN
jgi:CubicO group peptidase (beta-lactamase class C family)